MPRLLRAVVFVVFALLWLTGGVWLVLHFEFAQQTQFGPLPHPAEPAWMRVHGLLAVAGVFVLGWIAAAHVVERWGARSNRGSGVVLAASAAALLLSGYALYYTTGAVHESSARIHEVLGLLALLPALLHWSRRGASARLPQHGHPSPEGHALAHRFTAGSGRRQHRWKRVRKG